MSLSRSSQLNSATLAAVAKRTPLACWGDSLSALGSSDWLASFVSMYCSNPGSYNGGVGGEGSASISSRFFGAAARPLWNTVIWAGRNDIGGGFDAVAVRRAIMTMVDSLPHNRFRVLQILPSEDVAGHASEHLGTPTRTTLDALNLELSGLLGRHFTWLLPALLAGGTGTGQDATDVTNGIIPISLRQAGSGVHLSLISVAGSAGGNGIVRDTVGADIVANGWAA